MSKKAIVDFIGAPVSAYVGPGDIVSSAKCWWGLRGYNGAYATGSNAAVDIVDSSKANAATINILSTGALDNATLGTWIGSHGTAYITKLYDQSGGGIHVTQTGTVGTMPTLVQNAIGSLPGINIANASYSQLLTGVSSLTQAQPLTISGIFKRTGPTGTGDMIGNVATNYEQFMWPSSGFIGMAAGSNASISVTEGAWLSLQCIYNGASSICYHNGTNTTGLSCGTNSWGSAPILFSGTHAYTGGYMLECGIWGSAFSGGNNSSMYSNQKTYWGTP